MPVKSTPPADIELGFPLYATPLGLGDRRLVDIWDEHGNCLNEMMHGVPAAQGYAIAEAVNNYPDLKKAVHDFLTTGVFSLGYAEHHGDPSKKLDWVKVHRDHFDKLAKAIQKTE